MVTCCAIGPPRKGKTLKSQAFPIAMLMLFPLLTSATAQTSPVSQPIDSGVLVRLHLVSDSALQGRLVRAFTPGMAPISLYRFPGSPCTDVRDPGLVAPIRVVGIRRIDVSQHSQWLRGGVIGGLIGLVLGTNLGQFCIDGPCASTGHAMVHTGIPFALVLGMLGAGIGSGSQHWLTVR